MIRGVQHAGAGNDTLEVGRSKTGRVRLREHDAEALGGQRMQQRQADTQGEVTEPENTPT